MIVTDDIDVEYLENQRYPKDAKENATWIEHWMQFY